MVRRYDITLLLFFLLKFHMSKKPEPIIFTDPGTGEKVRASNIIEAKDDDGKLRKGTGLKPASGDQLAQLANKFNK